MTEWIMFSFIDSEDLTSFTDDACGGGVKDNRESSNGDDVSPSVGNLLDNQSGDGGARPTPPHQTLYLKECASSLDRALYSKIVTKYHKYRAQPLRPGRTINFLVYYNNKIIGTIGVADCSSMQVPKPIALFCGVPSGLTSTVENFIYKCLGIDLYRFTLIEQHSEKRPVNASQIIAVLCRLAPRLWYKHWGLVPKFIFTFTRPPFNARSYEAAGFKHIGWTSGKGGFLPQTGLGFNPGDKKPKATIFKGQRLMIHIKRLPEYRPPKDAMKQIQLMVPVADRFFTMSVTEAANIPPGAVRIDLQDLNDGYNDPQIIKKRLDVMLQVAQSGLKVIVNCTAGISRSNAMMAGLLVRLGLYPDFASAIAYIRTKVTPPNNVNPSEGMRQCVMEALKL